jgi:tetratricopeptide (TPR) repeat protein
MSATVGSWCARLLGATLALCVISISFPVAMAHAQEGEDAIASLDSAARALFEDGRRAFESGDFETALSRFQQAYDISHRTPLLWNLATTLDRLRRDEEALAMFEQYLAAAPEAANRTEVLGRIRVLRSAVEARRAETEAREAEARRLEEERRALEEEARRTGGSGGSSSGATDDSGGGGITPIVFIVGAGLTAVAGGVLIWSGVDTLTANDNYTRYFTEAPSPNVTEAEGLYHSALDAQTRTNVLVGVTAALAATTVILAIFTDWDGDPPSEPSDAAEPAAAAAPTVSLLPTFEVTPDGSFGGGGLSLRGSF